MYLSPLDVLRYGRGKAAGTGALWDSLARMPSTFPLPSLCVGQRCSHGRQHPSPRLRLWVCGRMTSWAMKPCSALLYVALRLLTGSTAGKGENHGRTLIDTNLEQGRGLPPS